MEEEYRWTGHALRRLAERTTLTPRELVDRLASDTCAIVATIIADPVVRYAVVWDEGLEKGILVILRRGKGAWNILTMYETWEYHVRVQGVVVMPHHLRYAEKVHRRSVFEQQQKECGGDAVRLYVVLRYLSDTSMKTKRHRIGTWPWDHFESKYQSLETLLQAPELAELAADIEVPQGSAIEMELYRSIYPKPRTLLGRVVVDEGM